MSKTRTQIPLSIVLMSLLLGFYIVIKCINWILVYGFLQGSESGLLSFLYPIVLIFILIIAFISKQKLMRNFNRVTNFLISYLIIFYFITLNFIGEPGISFLHFLAVVITGLIIPNIVQVDIRLVLKSIMFFPFIAVFKLDSVFFMERDWIDIISMDASYAFLIPVMAMVIYNFMYFRHETRKQKTLTLILSLINFIYLLKLLQFGSRGPILSLLLVIVFILIVKPRSNGLGVSINKSRLAFSTILLIVLFFSLDSILLLLDSMLGDSYFYGLEKTIKLYNENNISNSRNIFNIITFNSFLEKPIFGYGLDRFDANTGLGYPHNFILQILYDGGLFLFFILFIPVIVRLVKKYNKCTKDEYVILTFMLFSSVPYALLSQNMWNNAGLWLFFGVVLSKSIVYNKDRFINT